VQNRNAIEALLKAVNDKALRRPAVQPLGIIGSPRATTTLLKVLNDPDWLVRAATCQALAELVDIRAVPKLLKVLSDDDRTVAINAARALGAIGDRRATPALIRELKSEDRDFCRVIVLALRELHDPHSLETLIVELAARDAVSHEAARALGELADPAAIDSLAALIFAEPDDQYAADAGCEALEKIRSPRVIRVLVTGTIAAKKQSYHTYRARRTLDKLLDTDFAWNQEALVSWWAAHRHEFDVE
jgi:HEAT repeat protein